jgi:hypothetical protein
MMKIIPHQFRSRGQFESAVCRRCGFEHYGKWF